MCLAAPNNFAGFAAVRCLLGFAEGAVSPAFITITSIWYKKEEHPLRVGMWVTCNGLAQIAGMPASMFKHKQRPEIASNQVINNIAHRSEYLCIVNTDAF